MVTIRTPAPEAPLGETLWVAAGTLESLADMICAIAVSSARDANGKVVRVPIMRGELIDIAKAALQQATGATDVRQLDTPDPASWPRRPVS